MFKSKRSLNYANITATLALVFSMSGGALAANHYLISSTKQISPKVLKKLKGNAGAPGTPGSPGAPGAIGATGPQGKEGSQGKEGKEGKEGQEGQEGKQGQPGPGVEWALVNGEGTSIIEQSGGITISSHFTGGYYLDFPSEVGGHAISATVQGASFPPAGISAAPCGSGSDAITCFATGTNDPHHVFVAVVDKEGTETNKNFYIEVFK
jgi:hypothetical protein